MRVLTTAGAFIRRDWSIAVSYRFPFVLDVVGDVANLTVFFYLSKLVDGASGGARVLSEDGYFGFVTVAFALVVVMQTSMSSMALRLRSDQTTGTFEALYASPSPAALIVLSGGAFDMARGAVRGALWLVLGFAVYGLDFSSNPGALATGAAGVLVAFPLFMAFGLVLAALVVVIKQTAAVTDLVIVGLVLLAGVYFPRDLLPASLQWLAEASPFTWAVDVVRGGLVQNEANLTALAVLAGAAAIGLPVASRLLGRALDRARRTGSLGHY